MLTVIKRYILAILCFLNCKIVISKLEICGSLPGYQLFDLLTQNPKEQIEGYHELWISKLMESLKDSQKQKAEVDCWLFDEFTQSEAREILKPILARNGFHLSKAMIKRCFREEPTITFEEKPQQQNCFEFLSSEQSMREIFRASVNIFEICTGHILLVLGQTPAYIINMLKEINTQETSAEKITIIEIPFSGKPDTILARIKSDETVNKITWHPWHWTMSSFHAIVTKTREFFFRKLITEFGFSPFNQLLNNPLQKVFILDNSRGPSVASFLLLLARWFKDEQKELPDLYFINLDEPAQLDFRMNSTLTFKIDTFYISMNQELLNIYLDQIDPELRIMPPFPASSWNCESYKLLIDKYPQQKALELMRIHQDFVRNQLL